MFWSNACPWTDRYAPRLADLVARYGASGMGVALVNAGDPGDPAETAEASRQYLADAGLAVPYLLDPDGSLAAAFGATNAPHAFFFGPDGALRYDGAIDDSPASAARARTPYLAQAIDQSASPASPSPSPVPSPSGARCGATPPRDAPPPDAQ